MKLLLQRVTEGAVEVAGARVGAIGRGFVVLLCVEGADSESDAVYLAEKVAKMRVFEDDAGRMNRSLLDTGGAALVVSQFTLAAEWRKGNRPSFSRAAAPEPARAMYLRFCDALRAAGVQRVETGEFAAAMTVRIVNDGPVTIWMDSTQ